MSQAEEREEGTLGSVNSINRKLGVCVCVCVCVCEREREREREREKKKKKKKNKRRRRRRGRKREWKKGERMYDTTNSLVWLKKCPLCDTNGGVWEGGGESMSAGARLPTWSKSQLCHLPTI